MFQTCQPIIVAVLLDTIVKRDFHKFILWMVFDAVFQSVRFLIGAVGAYLSERFKQKIDCDIREDLATGLSFMSAKDFAKMSSGEYSSWFSTDVEAINTQGIETFENIIMYSAGVIFPMISLVMYHWSFLFSTMFVAVYMTVVPRLTTHTLQKASGQATLGQQQFMNIVVNMLEGFETLTAYKRQVNLKSNISEAAADLQNDKIRFAVVRQKIRVFTSQLSSIGNFIIMGQAAYLIYKGNISVGAFVSTVSLTGIIITSFGQLATLLTDQKSVDPIFAKFPFTEKILQQREYSRFENASVRIIDIQDVTVKSGENTWLRPMSFTIAEGDRIKLSGDSGSGKTTLARIIAGLEPDYSGKITATGRRVTEITDSVLYVPQETFVFNQSIRDNITLGRTIDDEKIWMALTRVGLKARIESLPDGLITIINTHGQDLSGGERQRLAVARALVLEVPIVILDEVTSNVDSTVAQMIYESFLTDAKLTVLYISHNDSETSVDNYVNKVVNVQTGIVTTV